MGTLYTSGSWRVKPGKEDEFVAAWQELASWTAAEMPGAMWATLIRDQDDPSRFLSFGPWESGDEIEA
jgi:quinol monooxygenase YgiN